MKYLQFLIISLKRIHCLVTKSFCNRIPSSFLTGLIGIVFISFFLNYSFYYQEPENIFRMVREITPQITLNLINNIIGQYNLTHEVMETANKTIDNPSALFEDDDTLVQAIVLKIAKELPQYEDIDIGKFLGIELNRDQRDGIAEVYKAFSKKKTELMEKIKEAMLNSERQLKELEEDYYYPLPEGDWKWDSKDGRFTIHYDKGNLFFYHTLPRGRLKDNLRMMIRVNANTKETELSLGIPNLHPNNTTSVRVDEFNILGFIYADGALFFIVSEIFFRKIENASPIPTEYYVSGELRIGFLTISEAKKQGIIK